jgi:hypothetical protein
MRLDDLGWRLPSSDRGGGNAGSAAQNLPRFSSTATTVLAAPSGEGGPPMDLSPGLPGDLPDFPEAPPADLSFDFPTALPADFPVVFPRDLQGELT